MCTKVILIKDIGTLISAAQSGAVTTLDAVSLCKTRRVPKLRFGETLLRDIGIQCYRAYLR